MDAQAQLQAMLIQTRIRDLRTEATAESAAALVRDAASCRPMTRSAPLREELVPLLGHARPART